MNLTTRFLLFPILLFISYLPFKVLYFISDIFYYLLYYIIRFRRKVVRKNLELSKVSKNKKDLLRIEKKFYRHLTDVFFEMFKFYSISPKEMKKRFYIENPEIFYEFEKKNKSVMFMTSHYGGFEWFFVNNISCPSTSFCRIYSIIK